MGLEPYGWKCTKQCQLQSNQELTVRNHKIQGTAETMHVVSDKGKVIVVTLHECIQVNDVILLGQVVYTIYT